MDTVQWTHCLQVVKILHSESLERAFCYQQKNGNLFNIFSYFGGERKTYKIHWTDKTAHSLSLTLLVLLFYMARLRIKTHSYTIYLSSAQRRRRRRYRDDRFSFNGFLSSSILPYNFLKYHCAIVEQLCMLEEKKNEEIKAESARISS